MLVEGIVIKGLFVKGLLVAGAGVVSYLAFREIEAYFESQRFRLDADPDLAAFMHRKRSTASDEELVKCGIFDRRNDRVVDVQVFRARNIDPLLKKLMGGGSYAEWSAISAAV